LPWTVLFVEDEPLIVTPVEFLEITFRAAALVPPTVLLEAPLR
jgi:hypothetical protein